MPTVAGAYGLTWRTFARWHPGWKRRDPGAGNVRWAWGRILDGGQRGRSGQGGRWMRSVVDVSDWLLRLKIHGGWGLVGVGGRVSVHKGQCRGFR